MRLSPLVRAYTPQDWLFDVVLLWKGKEYKRTFATYPHFTEAEATHHITIAICGGRRKLPEGHEFARPAITITDMKIYRRCNHPRYRTEAKDLTASEVLAKG